MSKVHDFQKSLKIGKKAENEFFELFKDKIIQESGYLADFTIKKNKKTIELKRDSYDPTKTKNFFIERFSYNEEDGGPYQSLKKNIDYYIYWFPITNEFFCFEVKNLVRWLQKNYEQPYLLNIYNTSHVTKGFLVPREELEEIRIAIEDIIL